MPLEFEWDLIKAAANQRKHGVAFDEAMQVFSDPRVLVRYDEVHSSVVDRWKAIGLSAKSRVLAVIYRNSNGKVRIISARKAESREKRAYNEAQS